MTENKNKTLKDLIQNEILMSNKIRESSIIIKEKVKLLFQEKNIEDSFSSMKILKNAVQCKLCNTIAVSEHHHHYSPCRCTFNHADGGNEYLRRSGCHAHEVSLYTYKEIDESEELTLLFKEQLLRFENLKKVRNNRYELEKETRLKEISSFLTLMLTKESYINIFNVIEFFLMSMHKNNQNLPKEIAQLTFRDFTVNFKDRESSYKICDEQSAIINYLFANNYYKEEEFENYKDRDWDNRRFFISDEIPKKDIFEKLNISMETLKQYQNMFNISYSKYLKTK